MVLNQKIKMLPRELEFIRFLPHCRARHCGRCSGAFGSRFDNGNGTLWMISNIDILYLLPILTLSMLQRLASVGSNVPSTVRVL